MIPGPKVVQLPFWPMRCSHVWCGHVYRHPDNARLVDQLRELFKHPGPTPDTSPSTGGPNFETHVLRFENDMRYIQPQRKNVYLVADVHRKTRKTESTPNLPTNISLIKLLDSSFPGNPLWAWEFHPLIQDYA